MNVRTYKTVKDRREALEKERSVVLKNIGSLYRGEDQASNRNCENMIGISQIPLGIAGPLKITSHHSSPITHHQYYIPLSTTEGALVASVNRGCKAITESGGAYVDSHRVGATRGPVFRVKNLHQSNEVYQYLIHNLSELNTIASETSSHIRLVKILTRGVGRYRYVRFVFDTNDAMGMNMVTIATEKLARFIEGKFNLQCVSLAGNFDVDKKPSWLNFIENRGTKVWAEVVLSEHVLKNILKTDAQKMYDVWLSKCMIGSAMSGSMGFNAQFANIISGIFLATGQDPGHIVEGSLGITTAEIDGDNLYVSVVLPDLMVGIVGGGTNLPTQKEALSIVGAKTSQEFAEVIGAAVLAGEISLLASLSEGTLAKSHEKLARGRV